MGSRHSALARNEEEQDHAHFAEQNGGLEPEDVNEDIAAENPANVNQDIAGHPNFIAQIGGIEPAEENEDVVPHNNAAFNQPANNFDSNQGAEPANLVLVNQNVEPANLVLVNQNKEPANALGEIEDPEHAWRHISSCVLEKVFSNLKFHERATASLVCKHWSDTYECPSLWHSVNLCFSNREYPRPCFNSKSIVQRFGRYFWHLGVFCRNERRRNIRPANRRISEFFQHMIHEEVQLESFKMPRMSVLTSFVNHKQLPVSESFLNFLRMQIGLTKVDFTKGRTYTESCLQILEALAAEHVEHLLLQGFFVLPAEILNAPIYPRYVNAITRFPHLRSLYVNYRYLTNEVMLTLAENLDGHLEVLGLLAETIHTIRHRLNVDSWNALVEKCPMIKVHFKMELNNMRTTHIIRTGILIPQIPIESMEYRLNPHFVAQFDIPLLEFLWTNNASTLKNMELDVRGLLDYEIRSGAVNLITNCPVLENLTLRLRYPFFEVNTFLNETLQAVHRLERASTLKSFRVTFRGLIIPRRGMKLELLNNYVPRFRAAGIELKLKMKK